MIEERYDWCPSCGDTIACSHRPDEDGVVGRVLEQANGFPAVIR
jgi:hypothetical protein